MWGHDHQSSIKYFDEKKQMLPLMLASGTTISSRVRSEANSFNLISIQGKDVVIHTIVHIEDEGFVKEKEFTGYLNR